VSHAAAFYNGESVGLVIESSPIALWTRRLPSFMPRASKVMAESASLARSVSQACVSARRECVKAY
jgi:hypothetical protein